MYKLGFCPNGPDCRYRHLKMPGPCPPIEESLQKIHMRANDAQTGTYRHGLNVAQEEARTWPPPSSTRPEGTTITGENAQKVQQLQPQPQEAEQQEQQQHKEALPPPPPLPQPPQLLKRPQQLPILSGQNQAQPQSQQTMANGPVNNYSSFDSASSQLPQGYSRYFIVKSSNRENLELSVMRGLWATHRNNEAKLNDAFDSCDNVVLVFSVNETGHFQGCAKMMSKIGVIIGGGGWKYAHGTAHYGRNFQLKWLKLCDLSFNKTRHLRNSYNENLPVKISRDCQELEPVVGNQLASLLYTEPDSDLMKVANEAELKREQEKARGTYLSQEAEDTNIVPFEDIDEDQEDGESDEDDSSSQTAGQSRGRSSSGRGSRSSLGLPGRGNRGRGRNTTGDIFALGYDRFGAGSADGFNIPGAGPGRGFSPYQPIPRYGGVDFPALRAGAAMGFANMDGPIAASGMPFPGRPPPNGMFLHNGPGMMGPPGTPLVVGVGPTNIMAPSRSHVMGGPVAGRHSRPGGMPFRPPHAGGRGRRGLTDQQKRRRNERNGIERSVTSGEPRNVGKPRKRLPASGETSGLGEVELHGSVEPQQRLGMGLASNSIAKDDDDSSSEDEAPRRSRYGEGKKKRRGGQAEDASVGPAWDRQLDQGNQWVETDSLQVAY